VGSYNRTVLVGRVVSGPTLKPVSGNRRVASFAIKLEGDKTWDAETGRWAGADCTVDCRAYESANSPRQLATVVKERVLPGRPFMVEGHLACEGGRLVVVVDAINFLPESTVPAHAAPSLETTPAKAKVAVKQTAGEAWESPF
jgi:hypothetical protein